MVVILINAMPVTADLSATVPLLCFQVRIGHALRGAVEIGAARIRFAKAPLKAGAAVRIGTQKLCRSFVAKESYSTCKKNSVLKTKAYFTHEINFSISPGPFQFKLL